MEECKSKCKGIMLLIMGLVLILTTLYTSWNIWIVIGTMLVIKGGLKLFMSGNCCTVEAPTAKSVTTKPKKR